LLRARLGDDRVQPVFLRDLIDSKHHPDYNSAHVLCDVAAMEKLIKSVLEGK
jgi:hypothetical protein